MYNQDEYIFEEFNNNFQSKKNEQIAIYGIGIATGKLIERIYDYNIVGLMDGKLKSGFAWGKPIIDYDDVIQLGVKIIVIVARPAVIGMLYHRIKEFTSQNDIYVADVHGTNLAIKYQNRECDVPFYHKCWDDIYSACDKHQVVTFDIFDTLLIRKTLYPKDIFQIVERAMMHEKDSISDYAVLRMKAEGNLYEREKNPNIYEIYKELGTITGAGKDVLERYMDLEVETELKFIAPRKSMLVFFNKIKDSKNIYLISDMYLTKEIIERMLSKCGYEGYKDIYVSCEYDCTKPSGLFDVFLSHNESGMDCIHIGDNYVADGESARAAGIDTFEIMSMREMLENSAYNSLLDKSKGLLDNVSIGLFCSRAFDNPFIFYEKKGKLELSNHRDIAYLCCAPVISYFSIWLMQKICKKNCDYVLYPSRDAFILQTICENIKKKQCFSSYPDGEYFYTSRRALFANAVFDRKDIEYVANLEFHGGLKELFLERFNIRIDDNEDGLIEESLEELLDKYEKQILANCERERDNYYRYVDRLSALNRIGFIDFVAAGSVQNGLRKIMSEKKIEGFYFLKRNTDNYELENCISVESFYKPQGDFQLDANVYKYYLFLELLLTSHEPTFHSMGDDLRPKFMKEVRSDEHISTIVDMQKEIMDYCFEISTVYPHLLEDGIDISVPDEMIGFLGKEYTQITSDNVLSLVLTDEYLSMKFNIFDR